MSKVPVFNKDGKNAGEVDLPAVFATVFRPDLIRKAVKVSQANARQPYGASPVAGERHSTESIGKGKGASRVPRLKQASGAALAPNVVGGRRAHPPQARTDYSLKMNIKERRLATASALAATASGELVNARGHKVSLKAYPVVVDDNIVALKTKDAKALFAAIGLDTDLERAKLGTHIRAGMGKLRGRKYRVPRSLLLVTAEPATAGASNFPGVDVVSVGSLGTEHLAPGGDAGRLTVYTKSAIAKIAEAYA